jgi:hypothetical protein
MSVQPLQTIIMKKIAHDVSALPPMLFDKLFNEVKTQLEQDIRKKIYKEIEEYFPYLVEEYLEEEIQSYTKSCKNIPSFPNVSCELQNIAYKTAANLILKYESELTEPTFLTLNPESEMDDSN